MRKVMARAMCGLPLTATPEQAAALKVKLLDGARAAGFDDAEDIYREIFPED